MSYQIFGRAIKNEYLSLGTIFGAVAVAYASMGGSKKAEPAHSGSSIQETLKKVKDAVPLSAGSSEEEQFIKQFIAEEEKKTHH